MSTWITTSSNSFMKIFEFVGRFLRLFSDDLCYGGGKTFLPFLGYENEVYFPLVGVFELPFLPPLLSLTSWSPSKLSSSSLTKGSAFSKRLSLEGAGAWPKSCLAPLPASLGLLGWNVWCSNRLITSDLKKTRQKWPSPKQDRDLCVKILRPRRCSCFWNFAPFSNQIQSNQIKSKHDAQYWVKSG